MALYANPHFVINLKDMEVFHLLLNSHLSGMML